jgi:hypothetical protein
MVERRSIAPEVVADVVAASRRRCCLCYALRTDTSEKKGQIAHLDRDSSNSAADNLAFLCLEHHDQYDSRTSQSKGLTIEEVKRYRTELLAFLARNLPPTDGEIVTALTAALDRPAFRTPFRHESSLPRFRNAIAETIETLNTGKTPQGVQLASKIQIRDPRLRSGIDTLVGALVALRAAFDDLLRQGAIRHCDCRDADCPVYHFSDVATREMDSRRRAILDAAHAINPTLPRNFYDVWQRKGEKHGPCGLTEMRAGEDQPSAEQAFEYFDRAASHHVTPRRPY